MKHYVTYGFGIALAGALLVLLEYFLGYHSDPDKLSTSQTISSIGGLAINIAGLVLGLIAVRDSRPDKCMSYGRGLGAGTLISLFAGIFGAVFFVLYGTVINPQFHDMIYQSAIAKMEANPQLPAEALEKARPIVKFTTGVVFTSVVQVVTAPVFGFIISLVVSAFVKRTPAPELPPLQEPPAASA